MKNLLPCPFCGSNELTETETFIQCDGCLCQALKIRWNTRASQWISVKDKLPEIIWGTSSYELLIVCMPDWRNTPFVKEGFYIKQKNGKERWKSSGGMQFQKNEVTHWMPLPSPPKETE